MLRRIWRKLTDASLRQNLIWSQVSHFHPKYSIKVVLFTIKVSKDECFWQSSVSCDDSSVNYDSLLEPKVDHFWNPKIRQLLEDFCKDLKLRLSERIDDGSHSMQLEKLYRQIQKNSRLHQPPDSDINVGNEHQLLTFVQGWQLTWQSHIRRELNLHSV